MINDNEVERVDNFTISMGEFEESRKEQNKNGFPGIDGLTPQLYEWAWEVTKDDVYEVINNCYYSKLYLKFIKNKTTL